MRYVAIIFPTLGFRAKEMNRRSFMFPRLHGFVTYGRANHPHPPDFPACLPACCGGVLGQKPVIRRSYNRTRLVKKTPTRWSQLSQGIRIKDGPLWKRKSFISFHNFDRLGLLCFTCVAVVNRSFMGMVFYYQVGSKFVWVCVENRAGNG